MDLGSIMYMEKRCTGRSAGFTLVEVLIALVVLSIGLVGMGALMIQGHQFTRSSLHRSQATFLVYDIVDRMRANGAGVQADHYDATTPGLVAACKAGGCTALQMAQNDVQEWLNAVQTALPGGCGSLRDIGTGEFEVMIQWQEIGGDAPDCVPPLAGNPAEFRTVVQP